MNFPVWQPMPVSTTLFSWNLIISELAALFYGAIVVLSFIQFMVNDPEIPGREMRLNNRLGILAAGMLVVTIFFGSLPTIVALTAICFWLKRGASTLA